MREYKFRGWSTSLDRWVYGSLATHQNGSCDICNHSEDGTLLTFAVDPESVGQFTGLKDKNGAEVYDGCLVAVSFSNKTSAIGVIKFTNMGWILEYDDGDYNSHLHYLADKMTVVGSIYANPELLESRE